MKFTDSATVVDLENLSAFLSEMNSLPEYHIGYCGTNQEEIYNTIIKDPELLKSFIIVKKGEKIISALGYDFYDETIELWGPFIREEYNTEMTTTLWAKMLTKLPKEVKYILGYCNEKNFKCITWLVDKKFDLSGKHTVLQIDPQSHKDSAGFHLLKDEYFKDFVVLHNNLFPNTYYTGMQILNKLDDNNAVLVETIDSSLVGYAFVTQDSLKNGNVEFIGVNPRYQKKGIGYKLMNGALDWFKLKKSREVILSVNANNTQAINLYKKVGFTIKDEMCSYRFKLEK
ncbi:GNAT family N-acetyltransferase [Alkalicella caledoniensis]|uniref:GNAT family N-acetyltransferase n=1 Tax=Alkalicella caledoniensis TaxID=2731377 RepID=A0A7G9W4Q4_ALKCA|nr:GNAT family N-acetyltransferase [Alkalicella caledoniensis]QNO13666.1 GNAT family N-acetyltransferase [Alkalicella caledoniensis]